MVPVPDSTASFFGLPGSSPAEPMVDHPSTGDFQASRPVNSTHAPSSVQPRGAKARNNETTASDRARRGDMRMDGPFDDEPVVMIDANNRLLTEPRTRGN